jgi:hypothetical protein
VSIRSTPRPNFNIDRDNPSAIGPRLAKLLPLLASDQPGEVVTTAWAIGQTLQRGGMDWHDLAALVSGEGKRQAAPAFTFATLAPRTARMRKDGANLAQGMTDMVDALDRKRGKGPQVVRVERVTVHQGGQAIVGTVQAGSAAAAGVAVPSLPALEQDLPVIPLNRRAGPAPALVRAGRHGEGGGA